jgi:hypothetical protein
VGFEFAEGWAYYLLCVLLQVCQGVVLHFNTQVSHVKKIQNEERRTSPREKFCVIKCLRSKKKE